MSSLTATNDNRGKLVVQPFELPKVGEESLIVAVDGKEVTELYCS